MTRTSKALKRLGVAGLAAVTIGAGIPAFFAGTAGAAVATGVTLTPESATAGINTCTAYTATVTPAPTSPDSTTVDVLLSQTNTAFGSGAATTASTLTFCDPDAAGAGTTPNQGQPTQNFSSGPGANAPAVGTNDDNACTGINQSSTQDSVTRCEGRFTTTGGTATVTFGVQSDKVGTVNIIAFFDQNSNRTPETFEPQDSSTLQVTSGTATQLVCTPETQSAPASGVNDFTCTATAGAVAATGSTIRYVVTSGPDINQTSTCGSAATPGTPTTSNNQGQSVCRVTNGGTLGSDAVTFFVEQNGQAGPQAGEPADTSTATFAGAGRSIACAPKDQTLKSADVSTVSCTVTDAKGNPVAPSVNGTNQPGGVSNNPTGASGTPTYVLFTSSGSGRFVDGTTTKTVPIGANGIASIQTTSQVNETGDQTVVGALSTQGPAGGNGVAYTTGEECNNAAGVTQSGVTPAPAAAGKCSDSVARHYTASGTPSATPTATTSPGACPGTAGNLQVRVNTPTINATGLASVTLTGAQAGQVIEVQGYSQNHFGTANFNNDPTPIDRTVTADNNGSATVNDLRPASNTRLRARQRGCGYGNIGSVINVRAQETLFVTRVGLRTYNISGKSIPARPGGLIINIYCDVCNPQLIGQPRADATNGQYARRVTFPASLQNKRVNLQARTGQDAQNAPGASNVRNLLVN